jgi:hypothetical protein
MAFEIRAMTFAELLDTSFQLLRRRFGLLFGLAACVHVPLAFAFEPWLGDAAAWEGLGEDALPAVLALSGTYGVAAVIGFTWVAASVTRAVGDVFLDRPTSFGAAASAGLRRLLPLLLTALVYAVIAVVAGALLVAIGTAGVVVPLIALGAGAESPFLAVAGFAAVFAMLAVVYVLIGTPSLILTQLVVLERFHTFGAIGRAFELVSGSRLRVLGITLVAGLLVGIPLGGLSIVGAFWPWIGAALNGLGQAVGSAFTSVAGVLLYFDLRCRKEAFDLEHLARLVDARSAGQGA